MVFLFFPWRERIPARDNGVRYKAVWVLEHKQDYTKWREYSERVAFSARGFEGFCYKKNKRLLFNNDDERKMVFLFFPWRERIHARDNGVHYKAVWVLEHKQDYTKWREYSERVAFSARGFEGFCYKKKIKIAVLLLLLKKWEKGFLAKRGFCLAVLRSRQAILRWRYKGCQACLNRTWNDNSE